VSANEKENNGKQSCVLYGLLVVGGGSGAQNGCWVLIIFYGYIPPCSETVNSLLFSQTTDILLTFDPHAKYQGVTKYRIGLVGPLCQCKLTHRTDE